MIRNGYNAFLAYAHVTSSVGSTVEEICIVKDFSNVFLRSCQVCLYIERLSLGLNYYQYSSDVHCYISYDTEGVKGT